MISQAQFEEEMQGRWAVCGHGKIGRMTHMHERGRQRIFAGRGFDGKAWQSMAPVRLHDDMQLLLDKAVARAQFDDTLRTFADEMGA